MRGVLAPLVVALAVATAATDTAATRHRLAHVDDVVSLPVGRYAEPRCAYTVRRHSRHGPVVTIHVAIGETLYHNWSCVPGDRKNAGDAYCMMVHNCTVSTNAAPQRSVGEDSVPADLIEMIDEFGCSRYPQIIPDVRYDGDLAAFVESQAFALDFDQPAIAFKCNIRLLLKADGACRRPRCP